MYAQIIYLGAISQAATQTLSEDSTVVAFIYGRFGVAIIESTPYVLVKCLCSRLMILSPSLKNILLGIHFCIYPSAPSLCRLIKKQWGKFSVKPGSLALCILAKVFSIQ
jgi:hypothetical protein